MGPLAQLVAALWLIVGGLWLTGDQLYALFLNRPFSNLQLAGGVVLALGGLLFGGYILRRLDAQVPSITEE